jgi:hypothetical protein
MLPLPLPQAQAQAKCLPLLSPSSPFKAADRLLSPNCPAA